MLKLTVARVQQVTPGTAWERRVDIARVAEIRGRVTLWVQVPRLKLGLCSRKSLMLGMGTAFERVVFRTGRDHTFN